MKSITFSSSETGINSLSSSLADRWTIVDKTIQQLRYRRVTAQIPEGCVLADLGCGNGHFLQHIKKKTVFRYGIDTQIKNASDNYDLSFKTGDLNARLPLDNETVDVVTALAVIEHLVKPEAFLEEIFRILKREGRCIITTPSPSGRPLLEFLAYRVKIISEKDIRDHKNYFDKRQLLRMFGRFRKVSIKLFMFGLNTFVVAYK
jgi:ubiquinone/menaquinone biosynthesis C-methylase UbiE